MNKKDILSINAIKFLGIDAINQANSGHPGIVLGAAPMAYSLFTNHLNINPNEPNWINRDRFILSAGHGSAMLYALNHLSGFDISLADIKNFRQLGNTPGHPEYGHTPGVETTSGPLGQGIGNAVGMAMAEMHLAARFNQPEFDIFNYHTYVICGDGDLQEGVAMEAMSLAGHLGLSKLIVLYDSNDIQLDGPTNLAFSENIKERFEAINWDYHLVKDGYDIHEINQAIIKAKKSNKPSLIEVKTVIGEDSINQGTSKTHGSPLGLADRNQIAHKLNWGFEPFVVPEEVYENFQDKVFNRGVDKYNKYQQMFAEYQEIYPKQAELLNKFYEEEIILDYHELAKLITKDSDATRNVSGMVINNLSEKYLNIIGGSADLTSSTKAKGAGNHFSKNTPLGRNINYGVREHAMGAINNGIALSKALRPFGGAFMVFSDYMKPAIRLAAIMNLPIVYVFTHDSLQVGEDGPTHQPVEQTLGLRAIPNLNVMRPCDAFETIASWKIAIESKTTPTALILTRQNVKNLTTTSYEGVSKGAYIVSKEENKLDGIIIATGSEVELALATKEILKQNNLDIRVVSMVSQFLFEQQTEEYKNSILPKVKTMSIELGSTLGWYKYADIAFGYDQFGFSAPANKIIEKVGFTAENAAKLFLT